jgi:hypothetical protein
MRRLKAADPQAYNRALFNSLMTPTVSRYNIDEMKGKIAARYMQEAAKAQSAVNTGKADPSSLRQFSMVPYQGQILPSETVIAIDELLRKIAGGAAPSAVIPRPAPKFKRKV